MNCLVHLPHQWLSRERPYVQGSLAGHTLLRCNSQTYPRLVGRDGVISAKATTLPTEPLPGPTTMKHETKLSGLIRDSMKRVGKRGDAECLVLLVWTVVGCLLAATVFSMLYRQASHFEESAFNLRCINRAQVKTSACFAPIIKSFSFV
jgi:hypothetical protein